MFNLYFAGYGSKEADLYLRKVNAHRLLSNFNERKLLQSWKADGLSGRLFIDSGAYSVAHSKAVIDIDEYIGYINNNSDIKIWVELDKIPYPVLNATTAVECSEISWKNYKYMRERVNPDVTLLPVYHFGEPISGLERILNTEVNGKLADYICIGGRHGVSTDEQIKYFRSIHKIIKQSDNPNVKVHGLGITVPRILESFPFYSSDSTTWLQLAVNGQILLKDLSYVVVSNQSTAKKENIFNRPKEAIEYVRKAVSEFGFTLEELSEDYNNRLRYNIDVLLNYEKNYTYKEGVGYMTMNLF